MGKIDWLIENWNTRIDIYYWKILLISLFLLLMDVVIFFALWYVHRGAIIRYGYPKRKEKYVEKLTKEFSFIDKILLFKLAKSADRKGFFIILQLIFNCLTILSFLCVCGGLLGNILFPGGGWSMLLMIIPMFFTMIITTGIGFIPDLICIPSERRRHHY